MVDNDGTRATLQFLHDLRWEDDSFGSRFDLDWGSINQEFAAGNIGMYTTGSDIYTALVRDFGLSSDVYGQADGNRSAEGDGVPGHHGYKQGSGRRGGQDDHAPLLMPAPMCRSWIHPAGMNAAATAPRLPRPISVAAIAHR